MRATTQRLIVVFSLVVALAICAYVAPALVGGRAATIDSILRQYKFTALAPPSTLVPPGTLVTVISEDPLVVGVICPSTESLGGELAKQLITSDSSASEEAAKLTGEFNLGIADQERLSAAVGSKFAKTIRVTLSNVKVVEIPDSVVFDLISGRKDSCSKAVEFRRKNGQKVSMIKSVIQASALYTVDFDGTVDAKSRADITRAIAGSLGLTEGSASNGTIRGDNLFWGVRDDPSLASVSNEKPPPTGAGADNRPRALPVGEAAEVIQAAEVINAGTTNQ